MDGRFYQQTPEAFGTLVFLQGSVFADTTHHIEVTPQIEQVIDGVIAIVCMLMPHESDKDDKLTDGETEQLNQELGI